MRESLEMRRLSRRSIEMPASLITDIKFRSVNHRIRKLNHEVGNGDLANMLIIRQPNKGNSNKAGASVGNFSKSL